MTTWPKSSSLFFCCTQEIDTVRRYPPWTWPKTTMTRFIPVTQVIQQTSCSVQVGSSYWDPLSEFPLVYADPQLRKSVLGHWNRHHMVIRKENPSGLKELQSNRCYTPRVKYKIIFFLEIPHPPIQINQLFSVSASWNHYPFKMDRYCTRIRYVEASRNHLTNMEGEPQIH